MYRLRLFIIVTLGVLVFTPSRSHAQPVPGFTLKATVSTGRHVKLEWSTPSDTLTHVYTVWRGILTDPATVDTSVPMSAITTTADTTSADTPLVRDTTYFLYVVKTTTYGRQTIQSSYAIVRVIPPVDEVDITSEPPAWARAGLLYTYQVKAVSSDSTAKLKYKLILSPGNMAIDSSSGIVLWTPTFRGYRNASLEALSSKGGKTLQSFSVSVGAGSGIVSGVVRDSATGLPVKHVFIRMYQANFQYHLGYYTTTDSTGSFTMKNVDSAVYFIHAYPFNPHFLPQWYNDSRYFPGAVKVTVADSPVVTTVDFSLLTDSVHLPIYRIQGEVADTGGKPIRGALVVWARAEFCLNGSVFDPSDSTHDADVRESFDPNNPLPSFDFNMDDATRWVYRAFTDSLGKYSLRIPKGFYIVRASHRGYYRMFYQGEDNIFESRIVGLGTDTTGINVSLTPFPAGPLGEISGMIADTISNRGVSARVVAYREWWTAHDLIPYHRHYVCDTDSLGNYDFTELPPGTYRILAMPLGQYVPSWYTSSGNLVVRWRRATPIVLSGNDVANADINVRPLARSGLGYTLIAGTVTSATAPGAVGKTLAGYPVAGGFVYAIDSSGAIEGYAVTDGTGAYAITGVAPGTYSLTMDAHDYAGAGAEGASPTYAPGGGAVGAIVNLNTTAEITGVEAPAASDVPATFTLEQNFPNPFNPSTEIRFSLATASTVHLVVYNILGQEVATLVTGYLQEGQHIVTWSGTNGAGRKAASGVYFYRLQANSVAGNFVQVKKMLLLK